MAESIAASGDDRDPRQDAPPQPAGSIGSDDPFAELRSLIVGPEQRELVALKFHMFDPAIQTREVSRVLPDAIVLRANDAHLSNALAPSIEEGITASVRRDPQPLADALFPVIGPAIRKAIAHTLASMMEAFNRNVEQSLSVEALKWRWAAWKTGKPFAEIVLLNTLQYRVEQVFLIHRETGLLLQHVARDAGTANDGDQVSAMLTAIRDFVHDSFQVASGGSLDAFRVGDLAITIEQGPQAVLAGVVRGTAPRSVQVLFQDALESVHRQLGSELRAFRGDAAPLDPARPVLETCLVTQFRQSSGPASYRRWIAAGAVVLAALGLWAAWGLRERQRWNAVLDRLRAEPGILIVSSTRQAGQHVVTGLLDPLARSPAEILAESPVASDAVDFRWQPYQSLHGPFVAARAADLLRPPPGVTLDFRDGVLSVQGPAPDRWLVESERLAAAIGGVRRLAHEGAPIELRLKEKIERLAVQFAKGDATLAPGQVDALRSAATFLGALNEAVRLRGVRARVEVLGHTDTDGSEAANEPLGRARAKAVLGFLPVQVWDSLELASRSVGSQMPVAEGTTENEKMRNRRTSFLVTIVTTAEEGSRRP